LIATGVKTGEVHSPFPTTHNFILPASYSLPYHSTTSPLASRPSSFGLVPNVVSSPVPNFVYGCPFLERDFSSWKPRHMSEERFLACSEWTARSSREVEVGEKRGEWKKAEKMERVAWRWMGDTSKLAGEGDVEESEERLSVRTWA
jgi:hypothetical protein